MTHDVVVLTIEQYDEMMNQLSTLEMDHANVSTQQLSPNSKRMIGNIQKLITDHNILSLILSNSVRNNDQLEKLMEKKDLYSYYVDCEWNTHQNEYVVSVEDNDGNTRQFRFKLPKNAKLINSDIPLIHEITTQAYETIKENILTRDAGYTDIISLSDFEKLIRPGLWKGDHYDYKMILMPKDPNPLELPIENLTVFQMRLCDVATGKCFTKFMIVRSNKKSFATMINKFLAKRRHEPPVDNVSKRRQTQTTTTNQQATVLALSLQQQQIRNVVKKYIGKNNINRPISKDDRMYKQEIQTQRKKWLAENPPVLVKKQQQRKPSSSSQQRLPTTTPKIQQPKQQTAQHSPSSSTKKKQISSLQSKSKSKPKQQQTPPLPDNFYQLFSKGEHPLLKAWRMFGK